MNYKNDPPENGSEGGRAATVHRLPSFSILGEELGNTTFELSDSIPASASVTPIFECNRPDEIAVENVLVDLAYAKNIPLAATNDVHFGKADMYEAHDALLCIADGRYVAEADRRRQVYGPNALPEPPPPNVGAVYLSQFKNPLV